MAVYTHRVQTVLSDEQFRLLNETSAKTGKPLSVLIREAIERMYFAPQEEQLRLEALHELLSLNAPVADWEQMEAELIRGAIMENESKT